MNKLLIFSLIAFLPILTHAQNTPRRVLGNFIHKGQVYNFDFSQDDADSYSIFLSKLDVSKSRSLSTTTGTAATTAVTSGTATGSTTSTATSGTLTSAISTITATISGTTTAVSATPANDSATYFSEFSKSVFDRIFIGQMETKFDLTADSILREKSSEIFFKIKSRLEFIDDEPTTAYFILRKDNINSFIKQNPGGYYDGRLSKPIAFHRIHKVLVETEDGTIKNIKVNVVERGQSIADNQSPRRFLEFKNQFPISISGKFDPERFANINLYCTDCNGTKGLSRFIKLADLMIFDILFENDKEDYSPVNRVISLAPNNPVVEVRKEKRSKILDVSAYTDFMGLNQEEPNGLIQFEVKRKVIINSTHRLLGANKRNKTSRVTSTKKNGDSKEYTMEEFVERFDLTGISLKPEEGSMTGDVVPYIIENGKKNKDSSNTTGLPEKVKIVNNRFRPVNSVWFNNVEFKLQFLKLEENNRYVQSSVLDAQQPSVYKLRPIDLYKYQLISVSPVLDIYKVNYTQLKFSWNVLHVGLNWFSVRVIDPAVTTPSTDPIKSIFLNNVMVQPGTSLTFRPDSRWGLTLGVAYLNQAIWSQQFDIDNREGLLQYYLNAHHQFSENTRLFFRFRLTHEVKYRYQNFTQLQLGYNVDLFNMKRRLPASN